MSCALQEDLKEAVETILEVSGCSDWILSQPINTYNPDIIRVWKANMDLQYILDPYACVMYIAAYMLKSERSMGELLKQVSKECGSEDIRTQLRRLGSVFLNHREVSAQEAVYRILSLPLKQLSRKVIFINTAANEDRVSLLKPMNQIQDMDEDSEDIYHQTSLIDMLQDHITSMTCALLSLLPTIPLAVDN